MDYIRLHGGPIVLCAWHELQAGWVGRNPAGWVVWDSGSATFAAHGAVHFMGVDCMQSRSQRKLNISA